MIKNCLYMYKKIWGYSKLRIILIFVVAFFAALNTCTDLLFFKFMIEGISEHRSYQYILVLIAIRLGILLLMQCVDNISNTVIFPFCDLKIKKGFSIELYKKVKDIDLIGFDNAKFYDKYSRAFNETEYRATGMLQTLSYVVSVTVQIIVVVITLAYINPVAILISIFGALVTAWANVVNTKAVYNYDLKKTKLFRGFEYIKRVFYIPEYSKDIRMTHLDQVMYKKFDRLTSDNRQVVKECAPKIAAVAISGSWAFNFLSVGVTSAFMVYKVYQGVLGIGDFVTAVYAVNNLSNNLLQFSNIIPQFSEHALFINNYLEVLNYQTQIQSEKDAEEISPFGKKEIELKNVSFHYPNVDCNAINSVSLHIRAGEKIAIVGENGAGKSTLIKLIMRLYEPDTGELCLDKTPYNQITKNSIAEVFSVVQQDFQHYALSIKENITLVGHRGQKEHTDDEAVWDAIRRVGLFEKIDSLPKGIDTQVTKEFDEEGLNFSGGQLQRLAIARMIYQNSGVMIMDEPSSSLDPISEAKIFDLIYELAKDKTLILVSHRLSGVKDMDRILYMEEGCIKESGTHAQLMQLDGKYAKMFKIQAERYGDNETV